MDILDGYQVDGLGFLGTNLENNWDKAVSEREHIQMNCAGDS